MCSSTFLGSVKVGVHRDAQKTVYQQETRVYANGYLGVWIHDAEGFGIVMLFIIHGKDEESNRDLVVF